MNGNTSKTEQKNINKEDEDEEDEYDNDEPVQDNLAFFNSKLLLKVSKPKKEKEPVEVTTEKFSIDLPTAPKKRLQEYLSSDIIDELENTDSKKENEIPNNANTNNTSNITPNFQINQPQLGQLPMQVNPIINQQLNQIVLNQQAQINQITLAQMQQQMAGNFDKNDLNLYQMQIMQQQQKKKKPFEIRDGDWTCFECHNLNFSFRKKCNRCGIDKEVSINKTLAFKPFYGYEGSQPNNFQ